MPIALQVGPALRARAHGQVDARKALERLEFGY
jgi:hypothetical protein